MISEGSFIEKLVANAEVELAVIVLSTEELITLVEKPHLFGTDVVALVGVPGGRYDAIWSSYIAPLRRVSLDTFDAEVKKLKEKERPAGPPTEIKPTRTPRSEYGNPNDPEVPANGIEGQDPETMET